MDTSSVDRKAAPSGRLIDLLSNNKSFRHRWIGSARANRLGLHAARVHLAAACAASRKRLAPGREPALAAAMRRDGLVVIENALPPALFEAARAEFHRCMARQAERVPVPACTSRGFGPKLRNAWGFDRYDGGSLNRFIDIPDDCPALREMLADDGVLARRLRPLCGARVSHERFQIYRLVHGPEERQPDLQRRIHCDTFHETCKLWYFFEPVTLAEGPLMYARGTHRNTRARVAWETRSILEGRSTSAAFRIDEAELASLGWQPPRPIETPANTLILADTRGFHCRSVAPAGAVRAGLYANLRPSAFALFASQP